MRRALVRSNELIINGRSSDSLPFYCVVEELDAPKKSEKKDKVFETDYADGYAVQTIDAYSGYERVYNFYLHNVVSSQIRQFKTFIPDSGWFKPYDDDLKYYFVKSALVFEPLDSVNGYVCVVTFFCQPFGMEDEVTNDLGDKLYNHTNAPMYPLIEIRGATGEETYLQIGDQKMTFKEIQDVIYIECKPRYQDAWSSGGRKVNNEIKGPFFEILPGENIVTHGQGITSIKITERWGWR